MTVNGETPTTTMGSRYWSRGGKGTVVYQEDVNSSSGLETALIMRYDSENKVYRLALLLQNGWVVLHGSWDGKSQRMTWDRRTDAWGNRGSGFHRFIDKDHSEWTHVITNSEGEVVLDLSTKVSRVGAADKE